MTSTFSLGGREAPPITLSALEFDVLWEHLRLGAMPLVVKVPSPGKTHEERAQLAARVWADLEARGLGRPVEVDPDIEELLGVLAKPQHEVDARVYVGQNVRLLAASVGETAVVAELTDGTVTLRRAPEAGLPSAALSVLPAAPAGPGRSVTLRTTEFERAALDAGRTREAFGAALQETGLRADDAEALVEMVKDVLHTGNFGVAARDRLGRRRRGERVVSFFDTEDGRYVQIRRPSDDGTMWTTISPADLRKLTHHVTELLDEVVAEAER
ncbi:ESX secretion-associated protein EspG [Actinophytocola sp.]|uniref:ESX secretion-associated protein EspG n=1 Tax=Actinophytocola sp. TaxID=1872138 RepID=UPI002D5ADE9D|nr:ESX secretion-associated protein EspG [Actinophytocola sp.]HYQ70157.1 ESX secretion-associated protein EspG [Actinophytocola sp.]